MRISSDVLRRNDVRIGAVVAAAVVVAIVVWVVAGRESSPQRTSVAPIAPVGLSASGLAAIAHRVGQPIYWAGPRKGYLYEFHRAEDGSAYIRYLPPGVDVGAPGAKYLTVATYPFGGAFQALQAVKDAEHVSIPGGGIAVISPTYKQSIHLAYPDVDYQVEVFDPSAERAREVVTSGKVRPA